jgi:hypothetical protein
MKTNRSLIRVVTLMLSLVGVLVMPAISVGAQGSTVLAVDPAQITLPLGNLFVVELAVTDGVKVNAFDIRITYDQQRLSLKSWQHGDYLRALSCLNEIKSPGLLDLDCTQLGQPEVNGDGVLLTLEFETQALGTADITLAEAVFADRNGAKTELERENGVVNIQNLATWTPTFTATQTRTQTPSATFTLSPTSTTLSPKPDEPTPTLSPSTMPTEGATSDPRTPTVDAPETTATRTTPISGVVEPVLRSPTPSLTSQLDTTPGLNETQGTASEGTAIAQGPETTEVEEGEDSADQAESVVDSEAESRSNKLAFWESILLIVLSGSLVALVIMIVILIRRRTQKEEDFLL